MSKFLRDEAAKSWEYLFGVETIGYPIRKSVNLCLEGGEEAVPRLG